MHQRCSVCFWVSCNKLFCDCCFAAMSSQLDANDLIEVEDLQNNADPFSERGVAI